MKKLFFLLAATLALACGWALASETVTVAVASDIQSLSPFKGRVGTDTILYSSVFQAMTRPDPITGEWRPYLAEEIELLPNGKDIRLKLRPGARFHTGGLVTAADVEFSCRMFADDKANPNIYARYFKRISAIQIIDDHNLILQFSSPAVDWERLLQIMYVGSQKYYEKVGAARFHSHPVGSGPFKFIKHEIGESVTLEAVANHPQCPPNFDRLVIRIIPDQLTRVFALETGQADLIFPVSSINVPRLEKTPGISVKTQVVPSFYGIAINSTAHPEILDTNFRLAINHAINRDEIVERLFQGQAYPLHSFISPTEFGYNPSIKFKFDPAKAKKILAKSAYRPGTPITATYLHKMPQAIEVFTAIQTYLGDIGVKLKMEQMEDVVFHTLARKKDPSLMLGASIWHGLQDPTMRLKLGVKTGGIYSLYQGRADIDQLIDEQDRTFDKPKRKALIEQIYQLLHQDPAFVPLFGLKAIYALGKRIDYNWTKYYPYAENLCTIRLLNK